MTQRWKDFFDSYGAFEPRWLSAAVAHWGFHEVLYGTIAKYVKAPGRILDVGSGPGWSAFYLSSLGYRVTGIDNEPSLVDLARMQSQRLNTGAEFLCEDAFDLRSLHGQFDLAFSCGVLEHFDREVTVQLLREQARCARYVVIQIPTRFSAYAAPLTDERMYTFKGLAGMVEDAGMRVVEKFGYGDVTATTSQIWMRRVLPRMVYRELQNRGFGYAMAVVGTSSTWAERP